MGRFILQFLSSRRKRSVAFTLIEMLTTIDILIIILGLMVSLARHVQQASAQQLTKDILHKFEDAMDQYITLNHGQPPDVPLFIADSNRSPTESALQRSAVLNNEAVVKALSDPRLNNRDHGLLNDRFDLSTAYYDGTAVRDAWGSPIVFLPRMHPAVGMSANGWFFFSAGPDRRYLTRDDNLYSYDQPNASGQ